MMVSFDEFKETGPEKLILLLLFDNTNDDGIISCSSPIPRPGGGVRNSSLWIFISLLLLLLLSSSLLLLLFCKFKSFDIIDGAKDEWEEEEGNERDEEFSWKKGVKSEVGNGLGS
jgi:hypothetical protein